MNENLFQTSIPIYVIIVFVVGIVLLFLELRINAKGVFGIIGIICELLGVVLSFISGVPVVEQLFLLVIVALIIMFIFFLHKRNLKE